MRITRHVVQIQHAQYQPRDKVADGRQHRDRPAMLMVTPERYHHRQRGRREGEEVYRVNPQSCRVLHIVLVSGTDAGAHFAEVILVG